MSAGVNEQQLLNITCAQSACPIGWDHEVCSSSTSGGGGGGGNGGGTEPPFLSPQQCLSCSDSAYTVDTDWDVCQSCPQYATWNPNSGPIPDADLHMLQHAYQWCLATSSTVYAALFIMSDLFGTVCWSGISNIAHQAVACAAHPPVVSLPRTAVDNANVSTKRCSTTANA